MRSNGTRAGKLGFVVLNDIGMDCYPHYQRLGNALREHFVIGIHDHVAEFLTAGISRHDGRDIIDFLGIGDGPELTPASEDEHNTTQRLSWRLPKWS